MTANVTMLEGTVENGQIKLAESITLPERTKVYVVIPGLNTMPVVRIASPRLANPEQASDFVMHVEDGSDAGL